MQLVELGQRWFAFGLTWIAGRDSPAEDIEAALGGLDDGAVFYVTLHGKARPEASTTPAGAPSSPRAHVFNFRSRADAERVIGYTVEKARPERLPMSYAAALASRQPDGLYIAALPDNQFWYCGVKNGVVVPDTDHIGTRDQIRGQVVTMSQGLGLPVFAGPGATIEGSQPFNLAEAAAGGSRSHMLRPLLAERQSKGPLILILALAAVVLGGGYYLLFPPKPKLTEAQQQAMMRKDYETAAINKIGTLPVHASWALHAYNRARAELPAFSAGWILQGVNCMPTSCRAIYATDGHHLFALSPLVQRFGHGHVNVLQNGTSLTVTLPLRPTPSIHFDGALLRALPPARVPVMDWVGAIPLSMDGGRVDGQVLDVNLAGELGGTAAGMPALYLQQASVKGDFFLDRTTLADVLRRGSRSGFVPVQIAWSYGLGTVPATWRMSWERVHG